MNKDKIRKSILNKRSMLTNDECSRLSLDIFNNFKSTEIMDFQNILVYADFNNEVKTKVIIDYILSLKRAVFLPKCNIKTKTFKPVRINENSEYTKNKYGISEPTIDIKSEDKKIDCAIVPGIAFDKRGNRIGFGCGYYDKFLSQNQDVFKIALCYEFQLIDNLEQSIYDVPMDIIVTENRIINIGDK